MIFKLLVIFVIVGVIAWARKATPAGDKQGSSLIGAVSDEHQPEELTVATFNVQTGKSNEGRRDILASAEVLKDVDLAGVQEVYAPNLMNWLGLGRSQTQTLAEYGAFSWLFCATRRRYFREHRGNALLSKLVVTNWQTLMLPDRSGKSFRNMTIAEVQWQGSHFHFINTHLHTKQGREEQLEIVLQEFAKYPRAILLGDFNSKSETKALSNALKDVEISDAVTLAGLDLQNPDRIDWILTKGFNVNSGKMLVKGVSDHPYYQVSLSYKM